MNTSKEIDYSKDDDLVFKMADEVQSILDNHKYHIELMINEVLKGLNIDKDTELRRDWDGVSSAEYMVQKMIGEVLANGKPKR